MSIHSSLKVDSAGSQQRTVLTRIERIKDLIKKGLWLNTQRSTALPKTKVIKIKAKKTKATAAEKTEAAAGAAGPTATSTAKDKK